MVSKNLQKSSAIQNSSVTLSSVSIAIIVCKILSFNTLKLQQFSLITNLQAIIIRRTHVNVEEDKIFRPAAWNAFGMDKEGSDYRACQNYGPIYK